jgi:hypothetical protein
LIEPAGPPIPPPVEMETNHLDACENAEACENTAIINNTFFIISDVDVSEGISKISSLAAHLKLNFLYGHTQVAYFANRAGSRTTFTWN